MTFNAPLASLRILELIAKSQKADGFPPTVRELADASNSDPATTHGHLRRLETMGLVEREPRSARAMRVTAKGRQVLSALHKGVAHDQANTGRL